MDESFDLQHLKMSGEEEELRTIDSERDSGIYDPSTSEVTTDAKRTRNDGRRKVCIPKCISDHKIITMLIPFIIGLAIGIIPLICILLVKGEKSCPICPPCESFPCPESWQRFQGKYFYISEKPKNWYMSSDKCSSLNTSLVVIDTQKELEYLMRTLDPSDYWFGLSKKDQFWIWPNGTKFTNQFPVEGEGACSYINGKGANRDICSAEKRFICSYPKHCPKAG